MRKLRLLLYAGTMASALAGSAYALEFPPSDGSTPTGPLQNAAGVGMPTLASGFQEVGSGYTMGQGQQLTPASSGGTTSPFSTPAPGTVIVRIDVQATAGFQFGGWTGQNGAGFNSSQALVSATNTNAATTAAIAGSQPSITGGEAGNKQQPYGVIGFWRLDFMVDGMSKAGMRYGLVSQIRQNAPNGQTTTGSTAAGVTNSANASATSSGVSSSNSQDTLYLKNMCMYVGSDTIGLFRIGQGSCVYAASALLTGLNDEFDYGGWDGAVTISPVTPAWPWPDSGSSYMPQGVAYLSPVIAGFDTVISFNPDNSSIITNTSCTSFEGCANQSTSNAPGDYARFINRLSVGLRYRNAFGPIGIALQGNWEISGVVQPGPTAGSTGLPAAAAAAAAGAKASLVGGVPMVVATAATSATTEGGVPVTAGSGAVRYNPLNIGTIGAEVSINKFFAVGANTMFGAFNGPGALQAKPYDQQTSSTVAIAWEAGAKMTIPTVPMTFGGSYYNFKYQGQPGVPTQRVSQGVDVGVTYGIGPGMVAYLEGLWGQIHQGDVNLLTGACGSSACSNNTFTNLNNTENVTIGLAGLALEF